MSARLTLVVLALMFTPSEHRRDIGAHRIDCPRRRDPSVEKVLGASADVDRLLVDRYYDLKARNGYSRDEIERKRFALEGVQVPVTARWNEELLRDQGWSSVECFWRALNFGGWLAVKD